MIPEKNKPLLVIVTGISGAGRSTALNVLEDLDLFCIDNLPIRLFDEAINMLQSSTIKSRGFVFGMDNRDREFIHSFDKLKSTLGHTINVDMLYLTAESSTIEFRYNNTRRRHPMMGRGVQNLADAIEEEINLFKPIKKVADFCIDTTDQSPDGLRSILEARYENRIPTRQLLVNITSFGFKYGAPRTADNIIDVRFLKNPHFIKNIREKNGMDREIIEFIEKENDTASYIEKLTDLYAYTLPLYYESGKRYLQLAVGCTGGKHRSVYVAQKLFEALRAKKLNGIHCNCYHRQI